MAAGCIPIVGFNVGAGKKERVKALFTKLLTYEALVGLIALLLVELCPRQLIAIFGAANESAYYTEFAIKAFRIRPLEPPFHKKCVSPDHYIRTYAFRNTMNMGLDEERAGMPNWIYAYPPLAVALL